MKNIFGLTEIKTMTSNGNHEKYRRQNLNRERHPWQKSKSRKISSAKHKSRHYSNRHQKAQKLASKKCKSLKISNAIKMIFYKCYDNPLGQLLKQFSKLIFFNENYCNVYTFTCSKRFFHDIKLCGNNQ